MVMMMMASMLLLVSIVKKTSRECQWRRSCNQLFDSSFNDSAQDDTDDDSKGDNYDEDVEDETAGLWMMRTMHNVLFGQYVFLPTEQAEAYLKMS